MRSDVRNTIIVPAGSSGNRDFLAESATLRDRASFARSATRAARGRARARACAPRLITTTWYWPICDTPSSTEMIVPVDLGVGGARA